MAQPTNPLLQQVYHLKRDSPEFREQLNTVLRGQDYEECRKALEMDDLMWFVDYLDGVRCCVLPFPALRSSQYYRFLAIPILSMVFPESVCANSAVSAGYTQCSRHLMQFSPSLYRRTPPRSPAEVFAMCTMGLSKVRVFVSNVYGPVRGS